MTLTEKAYLALRQDIVRGELEPDQPLRMAALSKRYDMGFSPIREALSRLHAERLVLLAPLRGFTVAPLSIEEMWDTVNLRILIECEALRLAIQKGGDSWEAGVVSTLHALTLQWLRRTGAADETLWELERRHHLFHSQLISACGSPRMLESAERLYFDTERYRLPMLLARGVDKVRDIQAEHTAIADATIGRKSDLATSLLAAHYRLTAESIEHQAKLARGLGNQRRAGSKGTGTPRLKATA